MTINSKIKMQNAKLQFKIQNVRFIAMIFGLSLLALPSITFGATLYFVPPDNQIYQGDEFAAEVRMDSESEPVNAVEVNINFSAGLLEAISVDKTQSILRLFPQEPSFSNALGIASIIGGLPSPGFAEKEGLIGKIVFRANKNGEAHLQISDSSRALKDDGSGTGAELIRRDMSVVVLVPPKNYKPVKPRITKDITPPDAFRPAIGQDPSSFGGQYFVAFITQDQESGIARYEVQEYANGKWGEWRVAVSPYVLERQEGRVRVFVKAVDSAGNETIATAEIIIPKKNFSLYLILLFLVFFVVGYVVWIRRHKRR